MRIPTPPGRLRGPARVPTVDRMRGTFRLALGAFALAALATFGCRTSALHPLYQTSGTAGGLPTNNPPIIQPAPGVPGENIPRPFIPTTPQVAETNSFMDGGSLLGVGGSGPSTLAPSAPTISGTSNSDAGSFSSLGAPGSTGIGAPGSTGIGAPGTVPTPGIGATGTPGFSPDGGAF